MQVQGKLGGDLNMSKAVCIITNPFCIAADVWTVKATRNGSKYEDS